MRSAVVVVVVTGVFAAVLWPLAETGFVEAFALFLLCVVALFGVFTVAAEARAEAEERARLEEQLAGLRGAPAREGEVA